VARVLDARCNMVAAGAGSQASRLGFVWREAVYREWDQVDQEDPVSLEAV